MNKDGKVRKYYFDASTNIKIAYEDENQFHKLVKSLKILIADVLLLKFKILYLI